MKLLAICSILVLLVGCSNSEFTSGPECSINKNVLTCNGEQIEVKDGAPGTRGNNGVDGTSGLFTDLIDPCGQEGQFDEVILVTRDGRFLSYFAGSDPTMSRLTLLTEGVNYRTTDGTNCAFTITNGVLID